MVLASINMASSPTRNFRFLIGYVSPFPPLSFPSAEIPDFSNIVITVGRNLNNKPSQGSGFTEEGTEKSRLLT